MAIKTKDEILSQIQARLGDDVSDDALSFIEDVSDTFSDLESKASNETNWEQKYKENDASWRTRYRERFFSGEENPNTIREDIDIENDEYKPKSFEELFKED